MAPKALLALLVVGVLALGAVAVCASHFAEEGERIRAEDEAKEAAEAAKRVRDAATVRAIAG